MKEYFVIFILFTIFILYSVTLVSKDLNRMRCIEGFEAPALTFLQAIRGHACSGDQQMHYEQVAGTDTYQLQCYNQCSSNNTDIPVSDDRSNCMIPSDSNTSNCEVTVSEKCYLDGDFHEISSNVNMYCPDSGYANCAPCVIPSPTSDCSIVDGNCQRTDLVTLPTGYARCTLSPSVNGVDHLTSDSNLVVSCDVTQCTSGTSTSSGGSTATSPIQTYKYTTIDQDYNIREGSWGFRNTLQYCIDHCNNEPSCKGFTRDTSVGNENSDGRCWFHDHIYDYGGDDDGERRLYKKNI